MMGQSVLLAQLLGLFFTVMGIGILFNRDHFHKVLTAVADNHAIQFVASIVPLLFGGYIIITHNCWDWSWPVLVTIIGWLIFLAGAFRAIFPTFWVGHIRKVSQKLPAGLIGAIIIILGLLFLYLGFIVVY